MPVQFDEYEAHFSEADWPIREGTNAYRILSFLLERPDTGYTPSEIAEETAVPQGSVGPTLQRLKARGLVRHKEPYWAAPSDDQLATYEGMLLSLESMDDRYGDEGWAAVDRSKHEVSEEELEAWRAEE